MGIENELEELLGKEVADRVKDLNHGDSILQTKGGQYMSVLQKLAAVCKESSPEYRQALLLSVFDNKQEAMLASDAITERLRYGVSIQPIVDRIYSQAGVHGGRVEAIVRALTHQSFTSNTSAASSALGRFFNKKKDEQQTL